ncbi:unnamed protein product [Ambrosiozyma monospora]|uniref:Unnamed protein product n=1 Tax=Ambrosiozyma monospora TaxID=43982 RepID=A0ACB5T2R9_AMBMO|nr:unnamed protein product [Ambrosiozyma monospora]
MPWSPLPNFICAKVCKPFTPLKDPTISSNKQVSQHLKNIFPGDLVYVFESCSTSKKWGRGYLVSQLDPSDFSLASVSCDVLPETKTSVIIFPMSHIKVLKEVQFTSSNKPSESVSGDTGSIYGHDESVEYNVTTDMNDSSKKNIKRPELPVNDCALSLQSLMDEVMSTLKSLNVHIYVMYVRGHLKYFNKLIKLFHELQDTWLNTECTLLTKEEYKKSKKKIAYLLLMVSKVLGAETNKMSTKDVAAYESILARDEVTGELFAPAREDYNNTLKDVARLAQNQVFGALARNYPVENSDIKAYPERNKQFSQSFPSHIIVDFKALSGKSSAIPKGYCGLTVYVYLRNNKKRLTESFAITIGANDHISFDGMSAALFKNIPANEIDSGRIYLVAVIVETIQLKPLKTDHNRPSLQAIRKGICAGAVDISRLFSRREHHLNSDESHTFSVNLYASIMTNGEKNVPFKVYPGMNPLLVESMTTLNNGWGELVDRLISGTSKDRKNAIL